MDETFRFVDKSLETLDFFLATVGLHYFSKNNWQSNPKLIQQIFNTFVALAIGLFTTGFVLFRTSNIVLWIEAICIWLTGVLALISVVVALVFRQKFRVFLEEMVFKDVILDMPFVDHVMKSSYGDGNLKKLQELIISTQNKIFKYSVMFLKYYAAATVTTALLYLLDTVFQIIVRKDESLRLFAFPMLFPWKTDDWTVYVASFIFHAYAGIFAALVYPCFQTTIVILVGQIIRQLHILTFILLHLDDLVMELVGERNRKWQACCTSLLAQCVDHYVKVKNFSNRLNYICRPFYLALILDAIFLVCVCSVKIAISQRLSHDLIKYCLHELFFTMMVYWFCFLGQQIKNECEKLEHAVTEKWYIFDRSHKKSILIFHMALKQNMPIYIFGTITLTLPTFTWFIKTGMSFFTLAMSVLED